MAALSFNILEKYHLTFLTKNEEIFLLFLTTFFTYLL